MAAEKHLSLRQLEGLMLGEARKQSLPPLAPGRSRMCVFMWTYMCRYMYLCVYIHIYMYISVYMFLLHNLHCLFLLVDVYNVCWG